VTEVELRAYIEVRRREVHAGRRRAVHQTEEWAADGAVHELDRLEGWLNVQRQCALAEALERQANEALRALQHREVVVER
jgi:hypothetical protein